jgi:lysophospholipase L1-like esterase
MGIRKWKGELIRMRSQPNGSAGPDRSSEHACRRVPDRGLSARRTLFPPLTAAVCAVGLCCPLRAEEPAGKPSVPAPATAAATQEAGPEPAPAVRRPQRPSRLLTRIREGKPVTIVGYGDSITYGQGVSEAPAESYLNVWARGLRQYFGADRIRLVNVSDPGVVSWYALKFIESHVAAEDPDLVILQFGGNDSREKVQFDTFWWSVEQMVLRLRATTEAEVVLVVPPMLDKSGDLQIIDAVWRLGKKQRVPVADFDRALRDQERDHRGLFPMDGHPNAYSHKTMARELQRTCAPLFGLQTPLTVDIRNQTWVALPGQPVTVGAELANDTQAQTTAKVSLGLSEPWGKSLEKELPVAPGKPERVELTAGVPELTARATQFRLWACAGAQDGFAFDQKWVTLAPIIAVGAAAPGEEPLPSLRLDKEAISTGPEEWQGPEDLSAAVRLSLTETSLRVSVRVFDDLLVRDYHSDPFENDCVELYFDTRPEADQGKLFYSPETVLLFVKPPTPAQPEAAFMPLSGLPPKMDGVSVTGQREPDGYSLQLDVPLKAFEGPDGKQLPRFGFDVAVDDCDEPGWRQTQMIWAGYRDNYLDPSRFGVVQLAGKVPPGARRLTVR